MSTNSLQAAKHAAFQAAYLEGVRLERGRITSILLMPEAQNRTAVANQLALTPGMTAETARSILAHVAVTPMVHENPFAQAMAAIGNPQVRFYAPAGPEHEMSAPECETALARQITEAFKKEAGQ